MAGMKQRLQDFRSVIVHGYSMPVLLSLALHGVMLVLLMVGWQQTSQKRIVPPSYIEASLVQQPKAKPRPQPPKPTVDREAQRRAEQQRAAERKRQEEARKAEARQQEQQRQKELALKREKEKQEQARREAEARKARELEQQRQKEAQRKKQQQEEDRRKQREVLKRLEQERLEQEMMAQAQAEHDQQQVSQYSALIKSLASQYWNRPPSARNNMVAEVRISLSPFGDLLDITLVQSSGNEPFDRSVMQAIRNAAPFSEFRELDRRIFDEYFRRITIRFRPEDLVR